MATKPAVRKTRAQWAAEVCAIHKQTVEGILKLGRTLMAAKAALKHGEFEKMIGSDLPFDASTAQRLMKIARDPRLKKAARVQVLPMAWGTLYELTKLSDPQFKQAVASGAINRQTTRAEVRSFRFKETTSPMFRVAPTGKNVVEYLPTETFRPVYRPPPPTIEHVAAEPSALRHIEQLVGELVAKVARGDVAVDADFIVTARRIAEQLLTAARRSGSGTAKKGAS